MIPCNHLGVEQPGGEEHLHAPVLSGCSALLCMLGELIDSSDVICHIFWNLVMFGFLPPFGPRYCGLPW